ncbi:efflux RND transporter periplasmic adaptor subunit [Altererythrobacter luteolus]|uniref:Efflux RND transporter periplasmic adaptor subunit n=1 Tax=Pontixanthobacter luteolus TaxID=295089 RepID=A0A6I4V528_9SPHN|nr:efflux RND transporter periplasmic adaptor subunit [Pontixanthobacter luteolus]MXP47970.1 efflux RND transporter periplasmic adaptor subunit [Pontixanthobacter luteolus]
MNYETTVRSEQAEYVGDSIETAGETQSKRKWIIAGLVLLGLIVAIAVAYMLVSSGAESADDREEQAAAITVISPGQATIDGEIVANGTLAARRELPVGVAGEGGRVVSVPVDAGDWVRAGQVLAVVDRSVQNQQVASAQASIAVAQADANLAQANLDRALQLVERGFISKADVDRLTATRDAAAARVKVSQAQARELSARNARLSIVAPASGLVLERSVEPGQVVSAGSGALFRIAKGGEMEMMARLSEMDLAKISTGVSATVVPTGSEKKFSGQIWQVSPTIDAQDRQGTARIALPYAPELRPGGFASATIASGTIVAPMLPESAILTDAQGNYVYIVDGDNKVVRRAVTTGLVTNDGIAIIDGLDGAEKVVLRAGGFLTPGETVDPRPINASEG